MMLYGCGGFQFFTEHDAVRRFHEHQSHGGMMLMELFATKAIFGIAAQRACRHTLFFIALGHQGNLKWVI
jgi:hypothetical protein